MVIQNSVFINLFNYNFMLNEFYYFKEVSIDSDESPVDIVYFVFSDPSDTDYLFCVEPDYWHAVVTSFNLRGINLKEIDL